MLRFGSGGAVRKLMDGGSEHVLGVDGLPLGIWAAVAASGEIVADFAIADDRIVAPLDERVQLALAGAEARCGVVPSEVRLVCVDDGGDGTTLGALREWLAERSIVFQVLDLDPPDPDSEGSNGAVRNGAGTDEVPGSMPADIRASMARARNAALW